MPNSPNFRAAEAVATLLNAGTYAAGITFTAEAKRRPKFKVETLSSLQVKVVPVPNYAVGVLNNGHNIIDCPCHILIVDKCDREDEDKQELLFGLMEAIVSRVSWNLLEEFEGPVGEEEAIQIAWDDEMLEDKGVFFGVIEVEYQYYDEE